MTESGGNTTTVTPAAAIASAMPCPSALAAVAENRPHAVGAIRQAAKTPRPRARIIVVASGKGGVGKTHIAANMAIGLAVAGRRVLLVDADLGLANVDLVLGERPRGDLGNVLAGRESLDDVIQDGPGGLRWIPGASYLSGTRIEDTRRENLLARLTALESEHEFLIIDAPAGIGRGVLSLAQQADQLLLVTTPEPTAMMDAYALLKALGAHAGRKNRKPAAKTPRTDSATPALAASWTTEADPPHTGLAGDVRLIVNMVTHRADADRVQKRIDLAARRFLGVPVGLLGYVYCDGHVAQAVRRRQPLVLAYPHSQAAWCMKRLSAALLEASQEAGASRFAFFRRLAQYFLAG
jgi:flagellar biosynthesis protein FlhG